MHREKAIAEWADMGAVSLRSAQGDRQATRSPVPHRFGPLRTCCTKPMAMVDARMTRADVK